MVEIHQRDLLSCFGVFWYVTHMEVYTHTPGKFNLGYSFTHMEVYITLIIQPYFK